MKAQWQRKPFSELAEFRNGLNFSSDPGGRGIKLLGVAEFGERFHLNPAELPVVAIGQKVEPSQLLADGDIVFVRSNGNRALIGRALLVSGLKEKVGHSGFTIRARLTSNAVLPEFVARFFHSSEARLQIRKLGGGTNISNLSQEILGGIEIPIPPREQQKEICKLLGGCESLISLAQLLHDKLCERKRGLMQQLLTGRKRFTEFVKSGKQVLTHYGPSPADWPVVHVGDVADEMSQKNVKGYEIPVLSCTKHRGLVDSLEYFGRRIFSEDTSPYKVVRRGDFAYATNHVEEGSIGYQNLHDAALISPMYTVFRTRAGVDHSFFFKLLKTKLYRHIFEANTNGTINRRGALRWDDFARIKVHLPGELEQRRIAAVLETCDREIELLQKQLDAFKEQKRGLIQKLLTGQIRVTNTKGKP